MPVQQNQLTVLLWHNAGNSWCFPFHGTAGLMGMELQLQRLKKETNIVPLGPSLDRLKNNEQLPERAIAITFDDGYKDNLELAAPLLERYNAPATFFICPDFLDGITDPWWEVLGWAIPQATNNSLNWETRFFNLDNFVDRHEAFNQIAEIVKRRNVHERWKAIENITQTLEPIGAWNDILSMMDWDDARKMAKKGFDLGSHSMRHVILTEETTEYQHSDLAEARTRLKDELGNLGQSIDILAYPNGSKLDYDEDTIHAAIEAGYRYAVTVEDSHNTSAQPPYEISRWMIDPEKGAPGIDALLASMN